MFSAVVHEKTERDIKFGNGQDGSEIFLARALLASFRCQFVAYGQPGCNFYFGLGLLDCVVILVANRFVPYDDSLPILDGPSMVLSRHLLAFFPCCSCMCYLIYEFWQETADLN